jgi:putative inorganic carbon (HCO3(-)) transporter
MTLGRARRLLLGALVLGLGSSISLSQTALALLVLAWLWRLRDPAARGCPPLLWPVASFGGLTILSALASDAPGASLFAAKSTLLALGLFAVADALEGAEAADRLLVGLAAVGAVAAALGLLQVALCPGQLPDYGWPGLLYHRCHRARGFFSIYMTLAGVLSLLLLAGLPRTLGTRHPGRAGAWLLMLAGLVASYTRGAWIGFGAGVLALLPALRRGRLLLVGGLAALVLLAALAGPHALQRRLQAMVDPAEQSVRERLFMWHSGVAMWRERPWLGVGPGGVKRLYPAYVSPDAGKRRTSHVHSAPLQILVERGLLGLAAWLWIWVAFVRRVLAVLRGLDPADERGRALVLGSLAAVTGFLVSGLSEYNFGDSEVVLLAWVLMAVPFAVARGRPRTPPAPRRGAGDREGAS